MILSKALEIVDRLKRNQYTTEDKVRWIADLDEQIINEIIANYTDAEDYSTWTRYGTDNTSLARDLVVPDMFAEIYEYKLEMEIDRANGELNKYNNAMILYNNMLADYRNWYNKNHTHKQSKIKGKW